MADSKITALTAITTVNPATYPLVIVDTSDTSMAGSGTTKKVTTNQLLGSGGTATLASATITGDLTVDTSTLKVDSANDRVGIGTATPRVSLDVASGDIYSSGQITWGGSSPTANQGFLSFTGGNAVIGSTGATALLSYTNGVERYNIGSTGIATWSNVGGVAGTAMTLNSTGLGVGTSPTQKFVCAGPRSYFAGGGAVYGIGIGFNTTRTAADHVFFLGATDSATPDLVFSGASGAELMRLNAAGNLGIGVQPSAGGSNYYKTLEIGKAGCGLFAATAPLTGSEFTYFSGNGVLAYNSGPEWTYGNNGAAAIYGIEDGVHKWYNATTGTAGVVFIPTQAMTLDASGNLLVGDTAQVAAEKLQVRQTVTNAWAVTMRSVTRGWLNRQSDANGGYAAYFEVGSSNTNVGSIVTTSSGTSFATTSDYRLKESVQPLVGGLARVSALKPLIYKWKIDGSNGEGFLAHELAEVVPLAVTGEKDAVNEDGSIKAQGVDLSKVVPILVAAIQELAAEVNALKNA